MPPGRPRKVSSPFLVARPWRICSLCGCRRTAITSNGAVADIFATSAPTHGRTTCKCFDGECLMALRDKTDIPWPISTAPGLRAQESGGRLINCYLDRLSNTGPAGRIYRRAHGLNAFGTSARSGYRCSIEVNGVLFSAINGQLEKWTSAGGASTNVGAL